MDVVNFNIEHGYLEGILRGFKQGLLTSHHYMNLTQCETLDDFKLQLAITDYGNFLQNEPSPLSTSTIADKATNKLVAEFKYLRSNASQPLAAFLDYLT
jgi:V-type H+-transporting ATPase subunit d